MKPFVVPVFLPHAGCPHRCVFCNQTAVTGTHDGFPAPEQMRTEIERFLSYNGRNRETTEIAFFGGNFLGLSRQRIQMCLDVASAYINAEKGDGLRFSTRPDTITCRTLQWIAPYPVTTVEIGVQSMADEVLTLSNRGHTAADTRRAISKIKKTSYQLGVQLMVGLPGDNPDISEASARAVVDLAPAFVRLYPVLVLKGSRLENWLREKRYQPLSLDDCVAQLKQLVQLFSAHHIKVIRMGLQATDGLSAGSVLAGPYHPALGHMVLSEIMRHHAEIEIRKLNPPISDLTLWVHPKSYSRMQGLNKGNLIKLKESFQLHRIHLLTDPGMSQWAVKVFKR